MTEKEKETIEDCKELVQELKQHKDKDFIGRLYYRNKPVEDILSVLLNLIEKQQKEQNSLKEIEQLHKEENGKLRFELEKITSEKSIGEHQYKELLRDLDEEKEKNNALKKHQKQYLDGELITAKQGKFFEKMIKENYISKDKIKEKIEQAKQKADDDNLDEYTKILAWKELLEEE